MEYKSLQALAQRTDLQKYGHNNLLLFALEIGLSIEDIHTVAANSLTDHFTAAFHQKPNIAYNEKGKIWESDAIYARFFNQKTSARHILFCYTLLKSIEETKMELNNIPEAERTATQKGQINFFRQRGSIYILCAAIANSCEIFLGRAIPDPFELMFPGKLTLNEAIKIWKPIIKIALAFSIYLSESLKSNLKIVATIRDDMNKFRSFIEATMAANTGIHESFRNSYDGIQ
jgi:hypothetical protein